MKHLLLMYLVLVCLLASCGGGGGLMIEGPNPNETRGPATVTWTATDSHTWTIEAWQPGINAGEDVTLWEGELQGLGTISHTFTDVGESERIRFRYWSGSEVNAQLDSILGPGTYTFAVRPIF